MEERQESWKSFSISTLSGSKEGKEREEELKAASLRGIALIFLKCLTVSAGGQGCLLPLIWQTGSVTPSACSLSAVWYCIILINAPLIPQKRLMNQTLYGTMRTSLLTACEIAVCEVVMIHRQAKREV